MATVTAKDDSAHTATITGSAAGETIDVAALVPQANDPSWNVQVHPGSGNDTIVGSGGRDTIFAAAGNDVSNGGGELDQLRFDLSGLGLSGQLSLDPGGPFQSVLLTNGGTTTTLFTITINVDGSLTINTTAATQAAFGEQTATNIEQLEFDLGAGNSLGVINGGERLSPRNSWK